METITYEELMTKQASMFFCALEHKHAEELHKELLHYIGDSYYMMASEISNVSHKETNGEHFHFIVFDFDESKYCSFRQKVFRTMFKLRGRAEAGLPRQYGMEKEIKKLHLACTYTVKEGNVRTNIPLEIINHWIDESFKKSDKQEKRQEFMVYMVDLIKPYTDWIDDLDDEETYVSKKINLYGAYFQYIRKSIYEYQFEQRQTFFNKSTTETCLREIIGKVNKDKHICLELIYKLNYNI